MISVASTSSLRIAHVADTHLGAGYVHGDEGKGGVNSRLVDFQNAWLRSCGQMVDEQVDLVLFAGDAFRDAKPTPTEQAAFREGLDAFAEAGIPVVMIPGNHDLARQVGRTNALAIFSEYPNVTVMDRPGVVFGGDVLLPIACLPYPMRAHLAARDPEFEQLSLDEQNAKMVDLSLQVLRSLGAEAEKLAGPFGCVLVAHGTIAGSAMGAEQGTQFLREAVLPLNELRGLPFRYQAWGHLHRLQALEPHIWYSGSIERNDFAEASEEKGWLLVEIDEDGLRYVQGESSGARDFVDIDLAEDIEQGLDELVAGNVVDVRGAVVRVKYTATPEVARTVDHAAIRRALYAAGAVKVHGPFATITRTVTEKAEGLDESTGMGQGWKQWADLQGLTGAQRTRLDDKVQTALEVCGG